MKSPHALAERTLRTLPDADLDYLRAEYERSIARIDLALTAEGDRTGNKIKARDMYSAAISHIIGIRADRAGADT